MNPFWKWTRKHVPNGQGALEQALAQAERVQNLKTDTKPVIARLRSLNRENHFAERVEAAFGGQ